MKRLLCVLGTLLYLAPAAAADSATSPSGLLTVSVPPPSSQAWHRRTR
jgi:hypothetical protein